MALKRLSPDCRIVPVKLDGLAVLVIACHPAHYAVAGYPASALHGLFGNFGGNDLANLAVFAGNVDDRFGLQGALFYGFATSHAYDCSVVSRHDAFLSN